VLDHDCWHFGPSAHCVQSGNRPSVTVEYEKTQPLICTSRARACACTQPRRGVEACGGCLAVRVYTPSRCVCLHSLDRGFVLASLAHYAIHTKKKKKKNDEKGDGLDQLRALVTLNTAKSL